GGVLMPGLWKPEPPGFEILGGRTALQTLARDGILMPLTAVSMAITPKQVRAGNEFNFEPIAEVGKLFLGIFIAIFPVLSILKA
ncbi:sodium:proton antiporter, partial [Neisseria meningitidis]|uniref:sodium:proton antiporter n=1 Tax=Neisseria meningitidis TaxID=487 RepID=UPI000CB47DAC